MKNTVWRVSGLVILLLLASGITLTAEKTERTAQRTAGLTVPVTGSNNFNGTATISQFERQGNQIVAVGFVRNSAGTAFAGVAWQVTLSADTASLAAFSGPTPGTPHLTRIAWSPNRQDSARLVQVQAPSSCGALNISLGATTVNLAGASVSLNPIGLNISGQSGTPVGGLVCSVLNIVSSVSGLVGDVASVVNLLNSLLGSLTGSLGGLTGGLAGGGTGGA